MPIRNRSVRNTLRTIIMLTSTIALFLASVAFILVDVVGSHRTLRSDLTVLADIIAANSAAPVMFADRESADAVLSALAARPAIEAACIYTKDGTAFAPYMTRTSHHAPPPTAPPVGTRSDRRHIEVTRPVMLDHEVIGTLYLVSDLRELIARIRRYVIAAVIILLLSLLIALAVSQPLQKILADPILRLASVAGRVRSAGDYSARADHPRGAAREIMALTSAFNEMLAGIQTRDRELEERRANLEVQVSERTAELRLANMELTSARDEAQRIADRNEYLARHKQDILNAAADGIFGIDDRGVATFINRAAASMLGSTVARLLERPLHPIIHEPELAALPIESCPVCRPKHASPGGSINFVSADGRTFPAEYTTTSMLDDDHHGGAVVTFRDVTERLAVDRMKDEFISTVSHELRTPLTSIRGALGLLGSGLLGDVPARAQRMLEIAVTNTDRLVRLINDILDLEKISSGKVELHRRPLAASALLRDAVDVVQNVADRAGVTLVREEVDATVMADRDRIVQTLTNLIGNAVKFSSAGSVVRIGGATEGGALLLFVEDEGVGIPAEKLEMIFERFNQVNASDSREKGGTGLGLAICRSIVDAHGGRIWAESGERRGSTFRFTIPLADDEGQAAASATPARYVLVWGKAASGGELAVAIAATGYQAVLLSALSEVVQHPKAAALILDLPDDETATEAMLECAKCAAVGHLPPIIIACDPPRFFEASAGLVAAWLRAPFTAENVATALATASSTTPVLIVEDDTDLARVIAASLENQGLRTVCVASGGAAIAACASLEPALVILDLALPGVDGFGVVQWMRHQQRLRNVPLLVYSAHEVATADQARLQLGQTEFLTKSRVPLTTLAQRVLALLNAQGVEEATNAA